MKSRHPITFSQSMCKPQGKGSFRMDIASMSESDIQEVKQIEKECEVSPWSLLDYQDEIKRKDSLTFVVKETSKVVGFIVARLITNQPLTLSNSQKIENISKEPEQKLSESEIEIYNLAVKPNLQQKGIGQMLINKLIEATNELHSRSIWLEVREFNIKAVRFYEKNGFTKVSRRKKFYSNPLEDGIIMSKTLTNY